MLMTLEQTKLGRSGKNKTAPHRSDSCCIRMAARNSLVKRTVASLAKEANGRRPAPLFGDLDGRRIVIERQAEITRPTE